MKEMSQKELEKYIANLQRSYDWRGMVIEDFLDFTEAVEKASMAWVKAKNKTLNIKH